MSDRLTLYVSASHYPLALAYLADHWLGKTPTTSNVSGTIAAVESGLIPDIRKGTPMSKTYQVWLHVEEHDEETDETQDIDLPFSATAEFSSEAEAVAFASYLHLGEGRPCEP
jgi:hypothetical protein